MWEETPGTPEGRVLDAHLAAMATAAATIEDLLGRWAQDWCRTTVEAAVEANSHRTQLLKSAGTYGQLLDEAAKLGAVLPGRIAAGLRASAWRHRYVDIQRDGTGTIMADLDYGTWQETGHKLPPAYEPVVEKELGRVTQLLRKYGYRPEVIPLGTKPRHAAPPQAIPAMETYYRLAIRLPEVVSAAEKAQRRAARDAAVALWEA
ncbi:MAG TPA: hypothetical protein VEH29_06940 [Acidimicrobiales bacterium]|nr:hypothetical protein [Acidimicrobiales bacterium]